MKKSLVWLGSKGKFTMQSNLTILKNSLVIHLGWPSGIDSGLENVLRDLKLDSLRCHELI